MTCDLSGAGFVASVKKYKYCVGTRCRVHSSSSSSTASLELSAENSVSRFGAFAIRQVLDCSIVEACSVSVTKFKIRTGIKHDKERSRISP